MSNHVFVSHSHQDGPAAGLIVEELEKRGVTCWIAPRDVTPGGSYAESILNAIESASCFVLVYSQHSNVSNHVLREVERALKFELNIVPVRFDDSAPSKSLDYLLATVHWLSVGQANQSQSIAKAAEQIAACIPKTDGAVPGGEKARAPSSQPVAVAPPASRSTLPIAWIAVALVIVASLVCWLVARSSTPARKSNDVAAIASGPSAPTAKAPAVSATVTKRVDASALPVAVTQNYFALLGKRDATAAYNLLTQDFRLHLSILRFSRTVSAKAVVKLVEATEVSRTDRAATVAAVFEDTDPAANPARWKGNIDFILESGAWRIASMKGLYPASGRLIRESDEEATQKINETTPAPAPSSPSSSPSPGPSPTPTTQKMRGIVQGPDGRATLHVHPFAHAPVVTPLKNGDRLEIDRIEGDWLHATTADKKSGFVHKSKVRINP